MEKILHSKFIIIIIALGEKWPCVQLEEMPCFIKSKMLRKKSVDIYNCKMPSIVSSIPISEMLKYEEILVLELMKNGYLYKLFDMKGRKHQIMCNYQRGSPIHLLGGESPMEVILFAELLDESGYTSWGVGRIAMFVGGQRRQKFWEEHREEKKR